MRISAKGRYALTAAVCLAQQYADDSYVSVISISDKIGVSKIYLEQVFSLLKRGGIVTATKGTQGGYQLARVPEKISALDILSAVESTLFEPAGDSGNNKAPEINKALKSLVFERLDGAVYEALGSVTLAGLVTEVARLDSEQGFMFYI